MILLTNPSSMANQREDRSVTETIILWCLQVLGAVVAILFGVFGALSWQVACQANDLSREANIKADVAQSQSDSANLIALLALCDQISTAEDVSWVLPSKNALGHYNC